MIPPFVVCITSLGRKRGKTRLGTLVVKELVKRGIPTASVKHCHEGVDVHEKDAERYLAEGAKVSIATSPSLTMILVPRNMGLLEASLFAGTPIVVAEGFKRERCDFRILVVETCDEISEALREGIEVHVAVSPSPCRSDGVKVFTFSDVEKLVDEIIDKALEHALAKLGGDNCGFCGYPTCRDAALAWLRGSDVRCAKWCVEIEVNGKRIPLNPFVRALVSAMLKSFVKTLKGVPPSIRELVVRVRDEG